MPRSRRVLVVALTTMLLLASSAIVPARAASTTYYVSCAGGDGGSGTSQTAAWKTLTRANRATLLPGDKLLIKRGCTFDGQRLDAAWTGTQSMPILISTYGIGNKPVIKNGLNQNVKVTGAWQVIEDLSVTVEPQAFTPCGNPMGEHYGFNVKDGAHHNTIRDSVATAELAGIHLAAGVHDNRIVRNVLRGNNMIKEFNADPEVDQGAWGILLNGDRNVISYNTFADNTAVCANGDWRLRSKSINIYEAIGNRISHNRSRDRVFAELGSSAARRTQGTLFAYNVFHTSMPDSRFVTTRGAGDTRWGPVLDTRLTHNSTYQTGADSIGISCALGCTSTILTTDSNSIWAEHLGVYADRDFGDARDLYWSTDGSPKTEAPGLAPSTIYANPRYVAPGLGDLRLSSTAPGVDRGRVTGTWTEDAWSVAVPQGASADIGAAERPDT